MVRADVPESVAFAGADERVRCSARCSRGTRSVSAACPRPATGSPPARPNELAAMRFTKRRDEWLLARWTAKQALAAELGLAARSRARWPGSRSARSSAARPRGRPRCFVDGVRYEIGVSLTDRAGWAVCTVGAVAGAGLRPRARRTPFRRASSATSSRRASRSRSHDPPVDRIGRRRRQPHLVCQGERVEGAAHRPPPRHAVGRGRASRPSRPSTGGSRSRVRTEEGSRTDRLVAAVRRVPAHRRHRPRRRRRRGRWSIRPGLATAGPSHSWLASPVYGET